MSTQRDLNSSKVLALIVQRCTRQLSNSDFYPVSTSSKVQTCSGRNEFVVPSHMAVRCQLRRPFVYVPLVYRLVRRFAQEF